MLSRGLLRQISKPVMGASRVSMRFSSGHAMPADFGISKVDNVEPIVKKCMDQAKAEKLTGDAYEARLQQLLSEQNMTLYHTNPDKGRELLSNIEHTKAHGQQTADLWKKISYFVFIPALIMAGVNSYFVEAEHAAHRHHMVESGEKPTQYPYQKWLVKDFFWGDGNKTLFWNSAVNHNKDE